MVRQNMGTLSIKVVEGTDLVETGAGLGSSLGRSTGFPNLFRRNPVSPPSGKANLGASHAVKITAELHHGELGNGFDGESSTAAVKTSAKIISPDDKSSRAVWNEDFFFEGVSHSMAVKITCTDKVMGRDSDEEEVVVGEVLVPVERLPHETPIEMWYQLQPPSTSDATFIKAAVFLRLCFHRGESAQGDVDFSDSAPGLPVLPTPSTIIPGGAIGADEATSGENGVPIHAGGTIQPGLPDVALSAGIVDYFLVIGAKADSEGHLQVAESVDSSIFSEARQSAATSSMEAGKSASPLGITQRLENCVLEMYPRQHRPHAPYNSLVDWFCFPGGLFLEASITRPPPRTSFFVTDSGVRSYGLCLTYYHQCKNKFDRKKADLPSDNAGDSPATSSEQTTSRVGKPRALDQDNSGDKEGSSISVWVPVCLCVITHLPLTLSLMPWLTTFYLCVERDRKSGGGMLSDNTKRKLATAVFQITVEAPLPLPGVCAVAVRSFVGESRGTDLATTSPVKEESGINGGALQTDYFRFRLSGVSDLPSLNFGLRHTLQCLGPEGVALLVAALLQESKVVLHSRNLSLLPMVAEGLVALMYPLVFPFTYMPMMPPIFIMLIDSPQPYLLGVHPDWLSCVDPVSLAEVVVVDCDSGIIDLHKTVVEPLPKKVHKDLTGAVRKALLPSSASADTAVRLAEVVAMSIPPTTGTLASPPASPGGADIQAEEEGSVARDRTLRMALLASFADMLLGYTECCFSVDPDQPPIFNNSRFLQEYCKEETVPFLERVINSMAFKVLLQSQDAPFLTPFRQVMEQARLEVINKPTDRRRISVCRGAMSIPTKAVTPPQGSPRSRLRGGDRRGEENMSDEELLTFVCPVLHLREKSDQPSHDADTAAGEVDGAREYSDDVAPSTDAEGAVLEEIREGSEDVSPKHLHSNHSSQSSGHQHTSSTASAQAHPWAAGRKISSDGVGLLGVSPPQAPTVNFAADLVLTRGAHAVFDEPQTLLRAAAASNMRRRTSSVTIGGSNGPHSRSGSLDDGVGSIGAPDTPLANGRVRSASQLESSWGGAAADVPSASLSANLLLRDVTWEYDAIMDSVEPFFPQPRQFTLEEMSEAVGYNLGAALRNQYATLQKSRPDNSLVPQDIHKLLVDAAKGWGWTDGEAEDGTPIDPATEKLWDCLQDVFSSKRVAEDVVHQVEELLRANKSVQQAFLQVLKQPGRRGAGNKGPFLLQGPEFETLARFSYTLLCVCVDGADYDTARALLQITGLYYQIHEGEGVAVAGKPQNMRGNEEGGGADEFNEFLSGRIRRHPIFSDVRFWLNILEQTVALQRAKIEARQEAKVFRRARSPRRLQTPGKGSSSPGNAFWGSDADMQIYDDEAEQHHADAESQVAVAMAVATMVCREAKALLYEMVGIGLTVRTAREFVHAVGAAHLLAADRIASLEEQVWVIWEFSRGRVDPSASPSLKSPTSPSHRVQSPIHASTRARVALGATGGSLVSPRGQLNPNVLQAHQQALDERTRAVVSAVAKTLSEVSSASIMRGVTSPNHRSPKTPDSICESGGTATPGQMNRSPISPGSPSSPVSLIRGEESYPGAGSGLPSLSSNLDMTKWPGGNAHQGPVLCVAASESFAASGSMDCQIRVFDLAQVDQGTGRAFTLEGHTAAVTCLGCQGNYVVSASADCTLRCWPVPFPTPGSPSQSLSSPGGGASSPSGWAVRRASSFMTRLGVGTDTAGDGAPVVMEGHTGGVLSMEVIGRAVASSGAPPLLLSGSEDKQMRLWESGTGRCHAIFKGHEGPVTCLSAQSWHGKQALSGSTDSTVRLWDVDESAGCKALCKFVGHTEPVNVVRFVGLHTAVSGSNDRTLRVWDKRVRWKAVGVAQGHTGPVTSVVVGPLDKFLLVTGSADRTVMVWDMRKTARGALFVMRGHTDSVTCLLRATDGVYSASEDAQLLEWDWDTGALRGGFKAHRGAISCAAVTDKALVTSGWDRSVTLWVRS